ncbi:hypothetical protein NSZ01_26050 [Nocardioides szechwanensis]|nr:hypothetical protein NSZ01_26050 [Nocardioides szechwanensis]
MLPATPPSRPTTRATDANTGHTQPLTRARPEWLGGRAGGSTGRGCVDEEGKPPQEACSGAPGGGDGGSQDGEVSSEFEGWSGSFTVTSSPGG